MPTWIRRFLAPPVFEGDEDKTRVARLLNAVLLSFLVVMTIYGIAAFAFPNPQAALPIVGLMLTFDLVALFSMRRGYVQVASFIFLGVVWILLTMVASFFGGTSGPAMFGYVVIVVMAGLLVGARGAFAFAGLSAVAGLGLVWAEANVLLPPTLGPNPPLAIWAAMALYVFMTAALLQIATRSLNEALRESRRYASELEEQRERLEETVEERTRDLLRRTRYLEATANVAREASSVLDLEEMLPRVVTLIAERFEFFRMGIFLLDPGGKWAVLRAASGEGGLRLLDDGFRLRVDGQGIVAHVIRTGRSYITPDVRKEPLYLEITEVADTRSELTLPLRARDEILGAMSVQSPELHAFADEDVVVLQTLADQVAMAIRNAQLFQQAQESLEAERRAYGELSREAWSELLRTQPGLGILRDEHGIAPAGTQLDPEVEQALQTGRAATSQDGARNLAVPVRVRGQVIGAIDAHKPEGAREWTPEQIVLLETLADQLGDALEDARLFEDARRRAIREQFTRQITTRIRESLDPDTILKTSVQELGRVLGAERVGIEITGPGESYRGSAEEKPVRANNGDAASPLAGE